MLQSMGLQSLHARGEGERVMALESREGIRDPCSALKGETVPDSLPATPKSPPTRRVPPRICLSQACAAVLSSPDGSPQPQWEEDSLQQ